MFYDADNDAFLADFGEDVVYAVPPAQGTTIKGIFDIKGLEVTVFDDRVESSGPQVQVKSSDVTGVKHGDTVTARGTTYYVRGISDDGTGFTVLTLSKD